MKRKKTLIDTNPYLKDPIMRKKLIERSVTTSCGVEGIILELKQPSRSEKSPTKKTKK